MNTQTITQAWNGTSWVNVFNKYTSAFDPNGNPAQSQIYKWNGTSWGLYQQLITGYDGFGDLTNFTQQIWSPSANGGLGAYINYYSEIYEYVLGDNTQFNNYQWDTTITPQTKTNLLQYTYSYDVNHNVLYELDQTFASDTLGSTDQYFYTYHSFNVSGLSELANDLHVSVFPNPSTGNSAVLSFDSDKVNPVFVTTYDALGKILSEIQLTTSSGMNQIPLNLAGTASGNYFVKIADNNGKISVVKFVKQ